MNPAKQNKTKQNKTKTKFSRKRKEVLFRGWKHLEADGGGHAPEACTASARPGNLCTTTVSIDWCPWIDAQGSVWDGIRKDIAVPTEAAMDLGDAEDAGQNE